CPPCRRTRRRSGRHRPRWRWRRRPAGRPPAPSRRTTGRVRGARRCGTAVRRLVSGPLVRAGAAAIEHAVTGSELVAAIQQPQATARSAVGLAPRWLRLAGRLFVCLTRVVCWARGGERPALARGRLSARWRDADASAAVGLAGAPGRAGAAARRRPARPAPARLG